MRTVSLRTEQDGRDHRYLRATLNTQGALVIEGQGPRAKNSIRFERWRVRVVSHNPAQAHSPIAHSPG